MGDPGRGLEYARSQSATSLALHRGIAHALSGCGCKTFGSHKAPEQCFNSQPRLSVCAIGCPHLVVLTKTFLFEFGSTPREYIDLPRAIAQMQRREAFLRRTAEGPTRLVMRVIKVPLKAPLADLAHIDVADPALRAKIAELRANKMHGVLVKGPLGKDDRLAIVLRPTAFVPPALQAEHYCFLWNGERIHQLFAFPTETEVIDPKDLMAKSRTAA